MARNTGADTLRSARLSETCIIAVTVTVTVVAAFLSFPRCAASETPQKDGRTLADSIQSAVGATVFIEVERSFRGERFTTTGTGFFITGDGHILTNSHVVSDWIEIPIRDEWVSVEVTVLTIKAVARPRTTHERQLLAKVVAIDRDRDLALLKASHASLDYLVLSPDAAAGLLDEVFILGYPFGEALVLDERGWVSREGGYPEVSVNSGRITSLRRDDDGNVVALQTDAAINPGNSGGPMISAEGELVGVVYAKFGTAQIGFAITPNRIWRFLEEQKIEARFVPSYVTVDRRPVHLRVEGGALLDAAVGGRAVVECHGVVSGHFELVPTSTGWTAAIEFPETADGETADDYIVHVFLEDERGHTVADRRYRLRRKDRPAAPPSGAERSTRKIENRLTLGDYARRQAAAEAVDEGIELKPTRTPAVDRLNDEPDEARFVESRDLSVDLDDLRIRAKTFYRGGNYEVAAEIFSQIVKADPTDEVSREYLDLSRGRLLLKDQAAGIGTSDVTDVEITPEERDPTAEITVVIDSPSSRGSVDLRLDGNPLPTHSFKAHDGGRVTFQLEIPAGTHTLDAELRSGRRSSGRFSFERTFANGSRWTLRFRTLSSDSNATAYLVERTH